MIVGNDVLVVLDLTDICLYGTQSEWVQIMDVCEKIDGMFDSFIRF